MQVVNTFHSESPLQGKPGPTYIGYVIPGDAGGDAECGLLVTCQ